MHEGSEPVTCRQPYYMGSRSTNPTTSVQIFDQIEIRLRLCRLWFCSKLLLTYTGCSSKSASSLMVCLGAYRTSSSRLCVLANEPPLYLRRKKLSMQYCLKLSATSQNPAYSAVFAGKFKSFFDNKPNQIPTLGIRVQPDLQAIGFEQRNTLQCSIPANSPWLFSRPCVNFDLHRFYKDDTAPDIYRSMFYEMCASYDNWYWFILTDFMHPALQ